MDGELKPVIVTETDQPATPAETGERNVESALASGALDSRGIAGAALSLAITPLWVEGLTAGQGWIAVGLVIFAGWNPLRAALGSYLFGAIRRLPLDLQNVGFFLRNPTYGYFMNMLPYLFTIAVLVIGSREAMRRRVGAPAALGQPYVREERGK